SPTTLRCDSETMKVSGNYFDGVAYVPWGKYTTSGEGNGHDRAGGSCGASPSNSYAGGIIAFGVNISGNFNPSIGARACPTAKAAPNSRTRSPLLDRATP
ncbi:MAG: hypothetical protein ABR609_02860, partial [Acidimicrobiia bacterium]